MKKILSITILLLCSGQIKSQDIPKYNHYFTYPYLYNPAFLGEKEAAELNLIYRKQWVGIEGAPTLMHAGFQLPLSKNIAVGLNALNLEEGLITSTSALGSIAYTLSLDRTKTLSFGISIGAGRTALDVSQITDFTDPAIAGSLDKSFYLEGQAGLNLRLNKLSLAFSLPTLFEKQTFSQEDFQEVALGPLKSTYSSLSYRFDLSPKVVLEPMGAYRTDNLLEDQWQAYATIYYDNLFWLGGNYSDGYGASAYLGFEINNLLKIGYSFDFANNDLSGYDSHEFYLSLKIGKKKFDRHEKYISQIDEPLTETITEEVEPEAIEKPEDEVIEEHEIAANPTVEEPKEETAQEKTLVPEKTVAEEKEPEVTVPEEIVEEEPVTVATVEEEPTEPQTMLEQNLPKETSNMEPGYYVVIGAFMYGENAIKYIKQVEAKGYKPAQAYNTKTKYHYVYLLHTQSKEEASKLRNDIRKLDMFKFSESWVLNIE